MEIPTCLTNDMLSSARLRLAEAKRMLLRAQVSLKDSSVTLIDAADLAIFDLLHGEESSASPGVE
jgi:hypothetical protein